METTLPDEKFTSSDIPLVAFLNAKNHKIIEQSQNQNNEIVTFTFNKTPELLEDLFLYTSNSPIPVQTFYKSLSFIWTLIKQGRKNETPSERTIS